MYFVFYKTNDVFAAEELLNKANITVEIVPTPVQDKAYCGVCVKIGKNEELALEVLKNMDFHSFK